MDASRAERCPARDEQPQAAKEKPATRHTAALIPVIVGSVMI